MAVVTPHAPVPHGRAWAWRGSRPCCSGRAHDAWVVEDDYDGEFQFWRVRRYGPAGACAVAACRGQSDAVRGHVLQNAAPRSAPGFCGGAPALVEGLCHGTRHHRPACTGAMRRPMLAPSLPRDTCCATCARCASCTRPASTLRTALADANDGVTVARQQPGACTCCEVARRQRRRNPGPQSPGCGRDAGAAVATPCSLRAGLAAGVCGV